MEVYGYVLEMEIIQNEQRNDIIETCNAHLPMSLAETWSCAFRKAERPPGGDACGVGHKWPDFPSENGKNFF